MDDCNSGGSDVASIPERADGPGFTPLLYDWRRVAALGWEGMVTRGRGIVVIDVSREKPVYSYFPGAPCEHFREMVGGYDPKREVLVCIDHGPGYQDGVMRLGGWPPPPEAFATVTAEEVEGVVH